MGYFILPSERQQQGTRAEGLELTLPCDISELYRQVHGYTQVMIGDMYLSYIHILPYCFYIIITYQLTLH